MSTLFIFKNNKKPFDKRFVCDIVVLMKGEKMTEKNPSYMVKNELTKINNLKSMLEDMDALYDENGDIDEQLLLNTIEGETNIHELLLEIENQVAEHEAMADAISLRIEQMQKRKSRALKTADTLRVIILSAMDKAGIKTIKGDLATLTVKAKKPSLIIDDESAIPSDYFKMKPTLEKTKIMQDLKEGKEIKGVQLDFGGISLQIRRA
jgi:hypothetical protein